MLCLHLPPARSLTEDVSWSTTRVQLRQADIYLDENNLKTLKKKRLQKLQIVFNKIETD